VLLLRPSERDELLLLSSRDLKDLIPGEKRLIGRLQDESMTTCFWEPASQAMILRTASSFFRSSHKGAKRAPARRCQGVPLMRVAFRTRACGHGCRVISGRWTMSDSSCPVKPRISIGDASWCFGTSVSRDAGIFFLQTIEFDYRNGTCVPAGGIVRLRSEAKAQREDFSALRSHPKHAVRTRASAGESPESGRKSDAAGTSGNARAQ
jgi:hypothetical protein